VTSAVDPFVQSVVQGTCGNLYGRLVGRLTSYPIPELALLPPGEGRSFLDIGCSWGRWSIAAANRGYRPIGIDQNVEALEAAQRVASQLGVPARYVSAEAQQLPFPDDTFDVVFSYSVLQHFTKEEAVRSLAEIGRVLRPGGTSLLQFASAWGPRNLQNQLRQRRFREPRRHFDVRYWRPAELRAEVAAHVGPTRLLADGYFTLNPQPSDLHLLGFPERAVVHVSETLRKASRHFGPLVNIADSIYAVSLGR
jgi:SAM-dependent methyltransferase